MYPGGPNLSRLGPGGETTAPGASLEKPSAAKPVSDIHGVGFNSGFHPYDKIRGDVEEWIKYLTGSIFSIYSIQFPVNAIIRRRIIG